MSFSKRDGATTQTVYCPSALSPSFQTPLLTYSRERRGNFSPKPLKSRGSMISIALPKESSWIVRTRLAWWAESGQDFKGNLYEWLCLGMYDDFREFLEQVPIAQRNSPYFLGAAVSTTEKIEMKLNHRGMVTLTKAGHFAMSLSWSCSARCASRYLQRQRQNINPRRMN